MCFDRTDDVSQQRVARRVTLAVIDLLEPVDVDVGEHQTSVSVPSTVDLAPNLDHSKLATEDAGEMVELRASQIGSRLLAIRRRVHAIRRRVHAIGGRERAVHLTMAAISCRVNPVVCRVLAVGRVLVSVRSPLLGVCWGLIAIGRHMITVGSRIRAIGLGAVVIGRHMVTVGSGALAIDGSFVPAQSVLIVLPLKLVPVRHQPLSGVVRPARRV
ncbi:MAG: hypothetical protein ABI323_03050 [Solirubrobacteraceae bacterium]